MSDKKTDKLTKNPVEDPRSESPGNSVIFRMILDHAWKKDKKLHKVLHFMRCIGMGVSYDEENGIEFRQGDMKDVEWTENRKTRLWPKKKEIIELLNSVEDDLT